MEDAEGVRKQNQKMRNDFFREKGIKNGKAPQKTMPKKQRSDGTTDEEKEAVIVSKNTCRGMNSLIVRKLEMEWHPCF